MRVFVLFGQAIPSIHPPAAMRTSNVTGRGTGALEKSIESASTERRMLYLRTCTKLHVPRCPGWMVNAICNNERTNATTANGSEKLQPPTLEHQIHPTGYARQQLVSPMEWVVVGVVKVKERIRLMHTHRPISQSVPFPLPAPPALSLCMSNRELNCNFAYDTDTKCMHAGGTV